MNQKNLGRSVNTDSDEFYPSIAKIGNLYFTAQYKDGVGRGYFCRLEKWTIRKALHWIPPSTRKDMNLMPLLIPMSNSLFSLAMDVKMIQVVEVIHEC